MTEPDYAKMYALQLNTGAVIDVPADAVEIANGMMIFYQMVEDTVEPVRGINIDTVLTFEVRDYDPDSVDAEDTAPTMMDSAWGYDPAGDTREGNPYVKVPDPFRGGLRFKEDG